jgi:hypothetical protein
MAASGRLTPDGLVRGGRMARPVKASMVKQLFAAPASDAP